LFLSVIFFGRLWCGVFCPQGALSEYAGRKGLNFAPPAWLFKGWLPLSSFVVVTVIGQTLGVRDYAAAALEVFLATTVLAVAVGFLFASERRLWCRSLCPVGPLLGVLARLGMAGFEKENGVHPCQCPTFINTQSKSSSSNCIECFRCAGPGGLRLTFRRPGKEIEEIGKRGGDIWEAVFLFCVTGLTLGAFYWLASPVYIQYKQTLGGLALNAGLADVIGKSGPWWTMVNYPEAGEVFNLLDVVSISTFMLLFMASTAAALFSLTALSSILTGKGLDGVKEVGYVYAPVALVSLILGLGAALFDVALGETLKKTLFIAAVLWSVWLSYRVVKRGLAIAPVLFGIFLSGFLGGKVIF
jgi:hypothetical protein